MLSILQVDVFKAHLMYFAPDLAGGHTLPMWQVHRQGCGLHDPGSKRARMTISTVTVRSFCPPQKEECHQVDQISSKRLMQGTGDPEMTAHAVPTRWLCDWQGRRDIAAEHLLSGCAHRLRHPRLAPTAFVPSS